MSRKASAEPNRPGPSSSPFPPREGGPGGLGSEEPPSPPAPLPSEGGERGEDDRPPDWRERERIARDLDTCLLVEAAAGTGKTTAMVGRMVNLLAEGKARAGNIAAVTFTRKAAAELRGRFRAELERASRDAIEPKRQLLADAVAHADRISIGTIHSFCARLLRERPVEAGVSVNFEELDEVADGRLRQRAWDEYVAELFARDDPVLAELEELGLEVNDLSEAFDSLANYPDVDEWPAPDVEMPDLKPAREALVAYAEHMRSLWPTLPEDSGNDKLIPLYRRIPRLVRQADIDRPRDLVAVLGDCKKAKIIHKEWPGRKEQATREEARWNQFVETHAQPAVERWRQHRYPAVLRAIRPAVAFYDRLRQEASGLNFQDLLIKAARLLRERPSVRRYFRERYTHLLVDEFQDTDPVQAEVILLLTAADADETVWHRCRPTPGSLFVVGDPKQSIYRFRRADIAIYNRVKDVLVAAGGEVVDLWTNFRSAGAVLDWVNGAFHEAFPEQATPYMPARRPMECGLAEAGAEAGVAVLSVPKEHGNNDAVLAYEADLVARAIRDAVERGARPDDHLIVTWQRKHLGLYSEKLQEHGIPHQVTGGSLPVPELAILHACLRAAVLPDDPVALVGALRGEAFGVSDSALYAFKRAGGRFHIHAPVPDGLPEADRTAFGDALGRSSKYHDWLVRLPAIVAVEKVVADLGLDARARAAPQGNVRAGTLAKGIEILRAQRDLGAAAELVDFLGELIENGGLDATPARPHDRSAVRVMNLHKVKGLEAPVVFLAAPAGDWEPGARLHVARGDQATRGYMAVCGPRRGYADGPLLACPAGWEELEAEEMRFQEAEKQRLFYVAATRAGRRLVISQRQTGNGKNPWQFFERFLQGGTALAEPAPAAPPPAPTRVVSQADMHKASAEIAGRWQAVHARSYRREAAKQLAQPRGTRALSAGEWGAEWGTLVHLLLQSAMRSPGADLRRQAFAWLTQSDAGRELAEPAVETVRAVTRSDLWRRAQAAARRLTEVPFDVLRAGQGGEPPLLLRGVIDLAFREPIGWVIVDYKTDGGDAGSVERLAEHYRPQVESYADAWQKLTGEPVAEAGLYFTRADRYVRI